MQVEKGCVLVKLFVAMSRWLMVACAHSLNPESAVQHVCRQRGSKDWSEIQVKTMHCISPKQAWCDAGVSHH